jgi:hypothetical protein
VKVRGRVKELQPYVDAALANGWTSKRDANGHLCFTPPTGAPPVRFSESPGSPAAIRSAIARFRRSGLRLESR